MSLCISCKFGNACPYMEGAEDFIHIMVTEDKRFQKLREQVEAFNLYLGQKYKFKGPLADRGFEVCIDISHCEGYQKLCLYVICPSDCPVDRPTGRASNGD